MDKKKLADEVTAEVLKETIEMPEKTRALMELTITALEVCHNLDKDSVKLLHTMCQGLYGEGVKAGTNVVKLILAKFDERKNRAN